jgi:hypothetical protein
MKWPRWRRVVLGAGVLLLLAVAGLWFVYRPWALTWGATPEELTREMPGDGIILDPDFNATRGVIIAGTPEEIWPWLVQMGYRRAGFYSWDRLDNDGIPSARTLLPQYQELEVGDSLPLTEHDFVAVTVMEPHSAMLWEYAGGAPSTVFTWAWGLYPTDEGHTRLVTRLRYRTTSLRARVMLDFFEIVMMRKCLLGIRKRVESESGS